MLQLLIVCRETLKVANRGKKFVLVFRLHFLSDGAKMRLKINRWLARANEFRHSPTEERGEFYDFFRLGRAFALFYGNVRWTATTQILGHIVLRNAPGLTSFRNALTQNTRINRFKLKHSFPLRLERVQREPIGLPMPTSLPLSAAILQSQHTTN